MMPKLFPLFPHSLSSPSLLPSFLSLRHRMGSDSCNHVARGSGLARTSARLGGDWEQRVRD